MSTLNWTELREFLDEKAAFYEKPNFIESDPIQIPHLFTKKEDVEIAGFLAATIAWGQRPTIIKNATFLVEQMDMAPHQFITQCTSNELERFANFKHRTFNFIDLQAFLFALKNIYKNHGGLEHVLSRHPDEMDQNIGAFKKVFFELPHETRSEKHLSNPLIGSAAKRINMYLRWMVRPAKNGVDFGIWTKLQPKHLYLPLDVHTASVSRKLGLLTRKQNDWKALTELNNNLRQLDPKDPVKYDYALFGLGVFEGFGK